MQFWEHLRIFDERYKVNGYYVAQVSKDTLSKNKSWFILWGKYDEPKRKQFVASKEIGMALVEAIYAPDNTQTLSQDKPEYNEQ